tara:strand:- start:293 stop:898 length:606 start_codon:yes stop_codon:yes gene_type:complete
MLEQIKTSNMSGKLEGLQAISTNTRSNPFCQKMSQSSDNIICSKCYSMATLNRGYFPSLEPALEYNSRLLSKPLEPEQLPKFKRKTEYIRFDAHGELINETHLDNYVKITKVYPDRKFALWSKRIPIIKKYFKNREIPENLRLIYSNPFINKVMDKPPVPFHKSFNNVTDDTKQNCTGQKCKDCLLCYTVNDVTTIVEAVK